MSFDLRVVNIRSKISIFQALEFIGVTLRHHHSTQQIICPFHEDTKPSARVYSDTGKLFCFTCHKIWDSLSLVMQAKNVSLYEAVDALEKRFEIDPSKIDLEATIRFNLSKEPVPDLTRLYSYVEERLIASRFKLGLQKYVKTLIALDTYAYYFKEEKVSPEQYRNALYAIIRVVSTCEKSLEQSSSL